MSPLEALAARVEQGEHKPTRAEKKAMRLLQLARRPPAPIQISSEATWQAAPPTGDVEIIRRRTV